MHRKIIGNRVDCLHVYYIFGRDAISAKSLVQQLAVVIKDVPKLFTINVGDKEEAYFSSLIASSKYKLSLYMNVKTLPTIIYPFILLHFGERRGSLMVSVLDSRSSGPSSSPGWGHCVVFLSKTLYSHGASLHPSV